MSKVPEFTLTREGWYATRIRAGRVINADKTKGKSQQLRLTIHTRDYDVFLARHLRLTELSRRLTPKGMTKQAAIFLRNAAAAESDAAFEYCIGRADEFAPPLPAPAAGGPGCWHTFEDLANDHASGELSRLYPSHAPSKRSIKDDAGKLVPICAALDPVYGTIGQVPIKRFTVEHALAVMGQLPPTVKRDTTRNSYWQVMHRVLELAVFPCRLIASNPLLREHRPKIRDGKIKYPYLFPVEDFLMLRYEGPATCEGVALASLELQALFGCLNREGARIAEFLGSPPDEENPERYGGLLWTGIDAVNGRINIGTRKNKRVGDWPAQPGTIEVLLALRDLVPGLAELPGPFYGLPLDQKYAQRLGALLKACGVTRHELFNGGRGRGKLRAHDTRATFVTLCKALGLSESFIMQRTGHEHSTMLAKYDHARDDWKSHRLGKLLRLDVAMGRERLGLGPLDLEAERARLGPDPLDPEDVESDTEALPCIVRHTVPQKWLATLAALGLGGRASLAEREAAPVVESVTAPAWDREPTAERGWGETKGETTWGWTAGLTGPLFSIGSMFDAGSEARGRTGKPLRAADFESEISLPEGTNEELSARSLVAGASEKTPSVSPDPGGVRHVSEAPADPYLETLRAARRQAEDDSNFAHAAALGQLIEQHIHSRAAAAPPKVASLADARKRRDEGGGK
jgi:hypothetical protein